jgi:glycosyltransferase involved in cell wall biosynthesis
VHSAEPRSDDHDKSLTVLIVVEPGLDGVFRHVEGLIDHLLRNGTRVHLAYSSQRSGAAMRQLVERVQTEGGEVMDMRVTNIPQPRDCVAIVRLAAMILRVRPDIVHAHSSKAGALVRVIACLFRRAVTFYTPHAYYGMAKPPWLRVRFFNQVERLLGRIGCTITISQDEADFAVNTLHVPRERLVIIHNPVDTIRFVPATIEERRAARAQFGIPDDAIVLATIGRMCWQKDPETAYGAVAPVCAENPRLLFLHLGWGKWKQYLFGLARRLGYGSQLRILDYVEDPRSFYHAIDGILVTSRYEAGWPLVVLEAMACNLPVVASTCPGMSDLGRAGLSHVWTFPPENSAAGTKSVRAWLASNMGSRAECNHRRFAMENLSPEHCYGATFELYCGHGVRTPRRETVETVAR